MSRFPSIVLVTCGALGGLVAIGCGDVSPSVEIVKTTPTRLDPSRDTADDLHVTVRYQDADGDLGGGVAEIHDCRGADLLTRLSLPHLASQAGVDAEVSIEGELELVVADVGVHETPSSAAKVCRDLEATATAFCVVLVDAAGNRGDGACTVPIEVIAGE